MSEREIARRRMISQQIARPQFAQPGDVVAWLGAVQAQDYLGALWAVALRVPGATEQAVERALADGAIIRTWPMRGTIHFVAPADVRWMLELLTPRVIQSSRSRRTQLGLDDQIVARSAEVLAKQLQGGRQLTRPALYDLLEQAGIATSGQRGLHILGQLAHEQLLCFGARNGKQPTFTLLDEWAPGAKSLPRDEALARLAQRYFASHGPATLHDFMWWSGLTAADAKAGLATVADRLQRAQLDGRDYYFAADAPPAPTAPLGTFLLPPFDEYLVAYRDRSASLDAAHSGLVVPGGNGIFNPIVVIDGRVVGTWKRSFKKDSVVITATPFDSFSAAQKAAIGHVAERYATFANKKLVAEI